MNIIYKNKYLKYKQKFLFLKNQIGGNPTKYLFICNKLDTSNIDYQYFNGHFNNIQPDITEIKQNDIDRSFYSTNQNKFDCIFILDCDDKIYQNIIYLYNLLKEDGIIYIKSSINLHIEQLRIELKERFDNFYIPSSLKLNQLKNIESIQLSKLLNDFFIHRREFNKQSEQKKLILPTIQPKYNYFEKQIGGLGCGRFALNNLFGEQLFIDPKKDTNDIPYEKRDILYLGQNIGPNHSGDIWQMNLNKFCKFIIKTNHITTEKKDKKTGEYVDTGVSALDNLCVETEYYDINTLMRALEVCGYHCFEITYVNVFKELDKYEELDDYIGFVINYPGHWVSLRKISNGYLYFNSLEHNYKYFRKIEDYSKEFYRHISKIILVFKRSEQNSNVLDIVNRPQFITNSGNDLLDDATMSEEFKRRKDNFNRLLKKMFKDSYLSKKDQQDVEQKIDVITKKYITDSIAIFDYTNKLHKYQIADIPNFIRNLLHIKSETELYHLIDSTIDGSNYFEEGSNYIANITPEIDEQLESQNLKNLKYGLSFILRLYIDNDEDAEIILSNFNKKENIILLINILLIDSQRITPLFEELLIKLKSSGNKVDIDNFIDKIFEENLDGIEFKEEENLLIELSTDFYNRFETAFQNVFQRRILDKNIKAIYDKINSFEDVDKITKRLQDIINDNLNDLISKENKIKVASEIEAIDLNRANLIPLIRGLINKLFQ